MDKKTNISKWIPKILLSLSCDHNLTFLQHSTISLTMHGFGCFFLNIFTSDLHTFYINLIGYAVGKNEHKKLKWFYVLNVAVGWLQCCAGDITLIHALYR